MTPFLQLAFSLGVIIAAAKLGGYLSYRFGQPTVLGELIAGIILGPSALNILDMPYFTDQHLREVINQMAEMGVLLLMFLAGLELHLSDLLRSGKVAAMAGTLGVVLPLALGAGCIDLLNGYRQLYFQRDGYRRSSLCNQNPESSIRKYRTKP